MNQKYLVIPRIEFIGANAQPAWWCVAPPGPSALCGFAESLGRALGQSEHQEGIGIVYHDWKLRAERVDWMVRPHQFRSASLIDKNDYVDGSMNLAGQPTIRGDGVLTLVIVFKEDARIDTDLVADFLIRARIAGGTISQHAFDAKRGHVYSSWDEAQVVLKTGFCLVDRMDLMAKTSDQDSRDTMSRFLDATRPVIKDKKTDAGKDPKTVKPSWLIPYVAGWRAITPIARRIGVRDGYQHAFTEPLIGLAQLASVRSKKIEIWHHERMNEETFILKSNQIASSLQSLPAVLA